jgi:hypothetical protein
MPARQWSGTPDQNNFGHLQRFNSASLGPILEPNTIAATQVDGMARQNDRMPVP